MCATVFYTKLIKGKLYPRAARAGPYAYANEVSRVRGKVVSKYLSIVKVPENASVAEKGNVVESEPGTDVVENGEVRETDVVERGEEHADGPCKPE